MIYTVRRFSYQETLKDGSEYISAQVDSGLGRIEDLTTQVLEDPRLKDLKPVKRHGKFIKSLTQLLRRKKKKKTKEYSDPTSSINVSEVNKFKTDLNRLTQSMGNQNPVK